MSDSRFLALPLDAQKLTHNLTYNWCEQGKLTLVDDMRSKMAVDDSTWAIESTALNSEGMLEYRFVFTLVLIL